VSEVDRLLSEYIAEHRAGGEADPLAYLDQLEGTDRAELSELIDAYLVRSPGQAWDAKAFAGSASERLAERLGEALTGQAGLWPVVLPRLRDRARLKRDEVVERLAEALGVGGREQKVERYYHGMEHGSLPSTGVSSKVLQALGGIFGASGEFLRSIGEPFGAGPGPAEGPVFARTATVQPEYLDADTAGPPSPGRTPDAAEQWDEVDELFRGGD
jgi:hypothetical protein